MLMKKIRAKFTKNKNSKYISHLDLMRLFQRAFRRADLNLRHTEGFNPQPKIAFGTALSLGTSSDGEYLDVELEAEITIEEFIKKINSVLPEGVKVLKAEYRTEKESIASLIRWGSYIVEIELENDIDKEELDEKILKFLNLDEIIITKEKKKKRKIITAEENIKDKIKNLDILLYKDKKCTFKATLMTGSNGNLKPELLLEAIEKYTDIKIKKDEAKIHRLDLLMEEEGKMVSPI